MGRGWSLNPSWAPVILKRKKYIYCGYFNYKSEVPPKNSKTSRGPRQAHICQVPTTLSKDSAFKLGQHPSLSRLSLLYNIGIASMYV